MASGTVPMSACLKVISIEFIKRTGLKFIKGIKAEDIPWFIDLLDKTEKCLLVNQYIYAYRQNVSGSITATGGMASFNDVLNTINREIELIDKRNFSDKGKEALYSFLAYELCILLACLRKLPKPIRHSKREELLKLKWLLKYKLNPKVAKVALLNNLLGIRITEFILGLYLKVK